MTLGIEEGDERVLPDEQYERLQELSPSAKFVFVVLRANGRLDQDELARRTLLPKRTVRYALEKLETAGLVEEQHGVDDARRREYHVRYRGPVEGAESRAGGRGQSSPKDV